MVSPSVNRTLIPAQSFIDLIISGGGEWSACGGTGEGGRAKEKEGKEGRYLLPVHMYAQLKIDAIGPFAPMIVPFL